LGLALDEPKEVENLVRINEMDVLMDSMVQPFTKDQVLDYIHSPDKQGFVFTSAGGGGC